MEAPDDERDGGSTEDPPAESTDDAARQSGDREPMSSGPEADSDPEPADAIDDRNGDGTVDAGSKESPERPPAPEDWHDADGPEKPPASAGGDEEALGWRIFVYDVVSSVLAVLVVGAYLYAVSGVWPPLVAVESRSMAPNMQVNDLVFVMEADRFPGPGAHGDSGVVTARAGQGVDYRTFGGPGDVIVYERDGNNHAIPIIHRAMFWVEAGENWYDRADKRYIDAEECGDAPGEALRNCPAPHAGFITKGDNNGRYDQVTSLSRPVRPEWVVGTAEVRVPGLGWIRLQSAAVTATSRSDGPTPAPAPAANGTRVPAG